jgi:Ni/Co efflux regulator RcnB
MKRKAFLAALAILAAAATDAAAAKPNHDHRGEPPSDANERQSAVNIDVSVILGGRERDVVRNYYQGGCPPGLAKKHNGCLPPGQAKKRYEVGRRIPDGVYVRDLPDELIVRLPRLPREYGYRMVDGDLVVVALATLIVMDAVGLY